MQVSGGRKLAGAVQRRTWVDGVKRWRLDCGTKGCYWKAGRLNAVLYPVPPFAKGPSASLPCKCDKNLQSSLAKNNIIFETTTKECFSFLEGNRHDVLCDR